MSDFKTGDRVRSRVSAQGMKAGEVFEVVAITERPVFRGGACRTYHVRRVGVAEHMLAVVNGHLVLEPESEACPYCKTQCERTDAKRYVNGLKPSGTSVGCEFCNPSPR